MRRRAVCGDNEEKYKQGEEWLSGSFSRAINNMIHVLRLSLVCVYKNTQRHTYSCIMWALSAADPNVQMVCDMFN